MTIVWWASRGLTLREPSGRRIRNLIMNLFDIITILFSFYCFRLVARTRAPSSWPCCRPTRILGVGAYSIAVAQRWLSGHGMDIEYLRLSVSSSPFLCSLFAPHSSSPAFSVSFSSSSLLLFLLPCFLSPSSSSFSDDEFLQKCIGAAGKHPGGRCLPHSWCKAFVAEPAPR